MTTIYARVYLTDFKIGRADKQGSTFDGSRHYTIYYIHQVGIALVELIDNRGIEGSKTVRPAYEILNWAMGKL